MAIGTLGGLGGGLGTAATGGNQSMEADFAATARTLGVDTGALTQAMHTAEAQAAGQMQAYMADGQLDDREQRSLESTLMQSVQKQLGLNNLTNEQMMALTNLCRACIDGMEKQAAAMNGVNLRQGSFAAGLNGGLGGAGAAPVGAAGGMGGGGMGGGHAH
jgi:hypothetical protein